jgi:GR25 family glycosyltransferase involved in LPS biosynthesis
MDSVMSFSDYFDKALCINLDRRTDRWEESLKEFNKIGIDNVKRISAIDGKTITYQKPYTSLAETACIMSHIKALTYAKSKKMSSVFIDEDDIQFADDFNEKFKEIEYRIPSDWQLLYLCINPDSGEYTRIYDNIYKIKGCYSAHAILYKHEVFDKAIEFLDNNRFPADVSLGLLQGFTNAYSIYPHLAYQRKDFSDIQNMNVDYVRFRHC